MHRMGSYYSSDDLSKFTEIKRQNKRLGDRFFTYYQSVFQNGVLSGREKALIGLSVAHAVRCPYCIDSFSQSCLEKGADEEQMNEAVHIAAAVVGGATLVHGHGVQMMNKVDDVLL